jgi:hypothetical protein
VKFVAIVLQFFSVIRELFSVACFGGFLVAALPRREIRGRFFKLLNS